MINVNNSFKLSILGFACATAAAAAFHLSKLPNVNDKHGCHNCQIKHFRQMLGVDTKLGFRRYDTLSKLPYLNNKHSLFFSASM